MSTHLPTLSQYKSPRDVAIQRVLMSINIYADLSLNAWASYTPLLGQLRPKRQSWEAQAIHRSPFRARQTKLSAQPGPSHPKNPRYLRKKKTEKAGNHCNAQNSVGFGLAALQETRRQRKQTGEFVNHQFHRFIPCMGSIDERGKKSQKSTSGGLQAKRHHRRKFTQIRMTHWVLQPLMLMYTGPFF